jgi:hypothetical protein
MSNDLELQIKVSKMLGMGFVCSILTIGGITSLIALILGLKARRIINQSGRAITGIRLAWWCIIAGGLGAIVSPLMIALVLLNPKK